LKKSIKYAGIAAATLLAVAPVAAPVVSSSTQNTVQAATTDTDANTSAMNDFAGQYKDYTIASGTDLSKTALVFGKAQSLTAFQTAFSSFVKYPLQNAVDAAATLAGTGDKAAAATVDVSAVTSNDTKVNSAGELNGYLKDDTTKAVTITATFNYKTTDGATATPITKTFTLTKAAVEQATALKSAAISYDKNINVEYGTSAADYKLVDSSNLSVKDNEGNELVGNGDDEINPSISQQFYTSYNDAYNAANGSTTVKGVDVSTFDQPNTTYYQVITGSFTPDSAFATLLKNHATTPANYGLTVNGATPTGSYTDPTSFQTASQKDGDTVTGKTFTVIRSITVGSKEAADWTTEDVDGVVTTKSDSAYYTLKNDDNDTITNRALAKNTAWKTNAVRTNSNGDKQYRVATGEWIDANDVTFSDGSSSSEGAYTDEQALNGKVTLDGPSSFIYMLYNDNGEAVSNRALAGDSAWYTDKKATNADGVTVYHVATGEWVQAGSGVNYVAY
jgi:hypothetical protein